MDKTATIGIWWTKLSDNAQQLLADRYYPKDDFFVTDRSSERIEKIYLAELKIIKDSISLS